jgi:hypothetical protein
VQLVAGDVETGVDGEVVEHVEMSMCGWLSKSVCVAVVACEITEGEIKRGHEQNGGSAALYAESVVKIASKQYTVV